ncbi:uncharacterized protein MEPE_04575 [Melanopsichium pennsylvanicum]|uniref:Uncharacterized protein n=2 Tax=Melanopsichium pennsylvanicum TaxID=63383 RepID=A0AAJ4XQ23_9BASI|nr:uncharacterized protein MEPE_04575 [Melanopsichium pennsylvanicum]
MLIGTSVIGTPIIAITTAIAIITIIITIVPAHVFMTALNPEAVGSTPSSSAHPSFTPTQSRSPIVLSEAWKQLHLPIPSAQMATPPRVSESTQSTQSGHDQDDSSDDGFLSDHSEQLHPDTGFDPFLAATRKVRQVSHLASSEASPSLEPPASGSSPTTSNQNVSYQAAAFNHQDQLKQHEADQWSRMAKYWSKLVDDAIFHPKQPKAGTIDLSNTKITHILPTIADLSRFVALPPPRYDTDVHSETSPVSQPQTLLESKTGGLIRHESYLAPFSAHIHNESAPTKPVNPNPNTTRSLSRSQSAFVPSLGRTRSFVRTDSAMSTLSSRSANSYRDYRDRQATLSIFLASNALTRLPSAFFQLQNLRVLSLRSNKLKFLPPAIGDLHNLSELHLPNNELQYLPAEILRLKLDVFTWFPNPLLLKPPNTGVLTVRPLLCYTAKRIRQLDTLNKLSELDELDETVDASITPIRGDGDAADRVELVPVSQQPTPLIRAPAPSSARQQRHWDRTRSEMQVERFLALGIEQMRAANFASITEQEGDGSDDGNDLEINTNVADTTVDRDHTAFHLSAVNTSATNESSDDQVEQERQRILEAAFADEDSASAFDLTPSTEQDTFTRLKVPGRSRVLDTKQALSVPSLQEFCIRALLSPYDVASSTSQGIPSLFLSPIVQNSAGTQRRRSSSSRTNSRTNTPLFEAQLRNRTSSFGSNASRTRSFSSNGGPEDDKFGKRVPTLLEAYENGTLQSLVGELGHGLVPMLEAARRSATQDWGTKARMRSNSSAAAKRSFTRAQPGSDAFTAAPSKDGEVANKQMEHEDEAYDIFGSVEAPGSLDRGDDACANPWFSRCPNPKHCDESQMGHSAKNTGDIALHRGKRGFGSTSSISSLGTTLGAGKADPLSIDMERVPSTAASSDISATPASPISCSVSSVGTVGGSSIPSLPESQIAAPFSGQQVRFAPHSQRSFASSGLNTRSWSSSRPSFGTDRHGMSRPSSTNFVRGFSTCSALSASGLNRSASFGPDHNADESERDWPLTEQEHRQAPVFSTPGETRLEWISHIGGIRVAKLGEVQVELDEGVNRISQPEGDKTSMLGAMGGVENKDLLPILWRGCSKGCLDFLI